MSSPFVQQEIKEYTPAEFQVEDLGYLETRDWSANWSEMGAYKTSTGLWLIERKMAEREIANPQVLIITTKSGKGTYFQLAPHILPNYHLLNVTTAGTKLVLNGIEVKYDLPEEAKLPVIAVAHYNIFTKRKQKLKEGEIPKVQMVDILLDKKWDIVILDEAHRIKNRDTNWTKSIKKLKADIKHVMTGTGFINDPSEVWSLLHFLDKRTFASYWKFRELFCEEEVTYEGYRKVIGINPAQKDNFRRLVRTVGPRRTKHEVFKNLPNPLFSPVEVELNPTQRKMYNDIKLQLFALDQAGEPLHSPNVLSALQRMRQISVATPRVVRTFYDEVQERMRQEVELIEPSSKLDALMELINGLEWDEDRKDQLVVFSNFRDPVELACTRFDKAGISYIRMDQKDNDRTRYEKWAIEFPKKEHQVFICTLQLGSESISLTSATTCVFLDRSWSPKDNEQGISRVWRPGQEDVANIVHINALDTTDQRIEKANIRKIGWFKEIFSQEDNSWLEEKVMNEAIFGQEDSSWMSESVEDSLAASPSTEPSECKHDFVAEHGSDAAWCVLCGEPKGG